MEQLRLRVDNNPPHACSYTFIRNLKIQFFYSIFSIPDLDSVAISY